MKNLASGFSSMLPVLSRRRELLESIVFYLYKSRMGRNAPRLPPVRFADGILQLTAINASWKKEGQVQIEKIRVEINKTLGDEIVTGVKWVSWTHLRAGRKEEVTDDQPVSIADLSDELRHAADSISDERTREAFLKLASAAAKLDKA